MKSNLVKKIALGLSILLTMGVAVTSLAMGIKNNGWFSKNESDEDTAALESGLIVSSSVITADSLIQLNAVRNVTSGTVGDGISALSDEATYTLTATITPSNATLKDVDWSVSWDNQSKDDYGGIIYTNSCWFYDETVVDSELSSSELASYGIYVTDFVTVTPLSDGSLNAVVSCSQPFGCPITITCTSRDNRNVSATCRVDYRCKYNGVNISASNIVLKSTGSNSPVTYSLSKTVGTLDSSYTVNAAYMQFCNDFYTLQADYGSDYKLSNGTYLSDGEIDLLSSANTSKTLLTIDSTWSSFASTYIFTHGSTATDDQKLLNLQTAKNLLNAIPTMTTSPFFRVYITLTDDYSGQVIQSQKEIYLTDLTQIPDNTVAVTNLSLSKNNLIF